MVKLKRAYEPADLGDGFRILVDRLWPRGVSKEKAKIDLWLREIAPSTELRKWFGHDPEKWDEFQERYRAELKDKGDLVDQIKAAASRRPITLIYSAHDEEHNDAVVLQKFLTNS
jgi:uncharacterized protein YeaO (DUF488 family)